jgi:hypothetical protein
LISAFETFILMTICRPLRSIPRIESIRLLARLNLLNWLLHIAEMARSIPGTIGTSRSHGQSIIEAESPGAIWLNSADIVIEDIHRVATATASIEADADGAAFWKCRQTVDAVNGIGLKLCNNSIATRYHPKCYLCDPTNSTMDSGFL